MATTPTRSPGVHRVIVAVFLALIVAVGFAPSMASAHDDIEGSSPESRSIIDDPISSVDIDFGAGIGPNTRLFLTYDPGDGEVVEIGGETVITGDESARLEFPELREQGTYFVQYLAPVPADGHVIAGSISFSWGRATALDDSDNPDVRTSTPGSREVLDDPIEFAEIQFNLEIEDGVELQLVYDGGNGIDFEDLPGTTTKVDERTARLDFDELPREGTYFVTYDAVALATGEEIVGATSFVFGQPSSDAGSSFPWLLFVPLALAVLGLGAWLSFRRAQSSDTDDESVDDEPSPELEPA